MERVKNVMIAYFSRILVTEFLVSKVSHPLRRWARLADSQHLFWGKGCEESQLDLSKATLCRQGTGPTSARTWQSTRPAPAAPNSSRIPRYLPPPLPPPTPARQFQLLQSSTRLRPTQRVVITWGTLCVGKSVTDALCHQRLGSSRLTF